MGHHGQEIGLFNSSLSSLKHSATRGTRDDPYHKAVMIHKTGPQSNFSHGAPMRFSLRVLGFLTMYMLYTSSFFFMCMPFLYPA